MEKLYTNASDSQVIVRKADNANIPADPENKDYQEYLALCDQHGESEITEAR